MPKLYETVGECCAQPRGVLRPAQINRLTTDQIRRKRIIAFAVYGKLAQPVDPLRQHAIAGRAVGIGDLRQQPEQLVVNIVLVVSKNRMVVFHITPHAPQYFEIFERGAVDLRAVETRTLRVVGISIASTFHES